MVVAWLDVFASSEVLFSVASDYLGTVLFASDDVCRLPDMFDRVKLVRQVEVSGGLLTLCGCTERLGPAAA